MRTPKILSVPLAQAILAQAEKPDGYSTNMTLPGFEASTKEDAFKVVARLIAINKLVSVRFSKYKTHANYFADVRLADEYRARMAPTLAPSVTAKTSDRRAPWPAGTEAVYPTDAQGRPLYKVTVGPSPAQSYRTNTHGAGY